MQMIAIELNLANFPSNFMKNLKYTRKFKELYSGHPFTYHLDYIVANFLLHLLYYISVYQFYF